MTIDLRDLYIAVLRDGCKANVKLGTNCVIEVVPPGRTVRKGAYDLVPNDLLSAIQNVDCNLTPFFQKLRSCDYDRLLRQGKSTTAAPPRPISFDTK